MKNRKQFGIEVYKEHYMDKKPQNDLKAPLHIEFAIYLTGHDRETVEQMYNDWIKFK